MFATLAKKVFGTANERYITSLKKDVEIINSHEDALQDLTDIELKNKTTEFKTRFKNGETLDQLLPEAFAVVREAAKRCLSMRHFDVQMMGGIVLHRGNISEMRTGEGKTLVATLPAYLNALSGKGVHIVTVNDYLAQRDSAWMGKIYEFLGLTVGVIIAGMDDEQRLIAYNTDITYGTNNEFAFDYLRDNMKLDIRTLVQRPFNYAIVDEVDSILIDEARTPLIISGPAETSSELYYMIDKIIPDLKEEDYEKDEKQRTVTLTDEGVEHVEDLLRKKDLLKQESLYDISNIALLHHVTQALRAHKLFSRDTDYIVKDNKVIIIDEFTGRMMEGRRYSDGLHQALEAKENAEVQLENQTLASITFQNYFRLYPKLSGMTGTAMTEAGEFDDIYKLQVFDIPTNKPCVRKDYDDEIYRTLEEKFDAILLIVKECQKKQQPVLIGTVSIEKSELLSKTLKKNKIPHKVLNARYHEQEAQIIAQAGQPGAVTIATNMAGRGTDIQLGGNLEMRLEDELASIKDQDKIKKKEEEIKQDIEKNKETVLKAGGLYIIGTERHESRRIDNQLRGRSGRQGDPGASKFFLSLQDDLMRIFGSERMDGMLKKLGLEEGEAITHPWINRALEKAQQKVEVRNYEIRKQLLKFDDVMNDQRKAIYEQRKELMTSEDISDTITDMRDEVLDNLISQCIPPKAYAEEWKLDTLHEECLRLFGLDLPVHEWAKEEGIADQEILDRIYQAHEKLRKDKETEYTAEIMRLAEKQILLQILDNQWKDHLLSLDHLRQGIHLRAHGQKDPLNEYKREAFEMFEDLLTRLRDTITSLLSHLKLQTSPVEAQNQYRKDHEQDAYTTNKPAELQEIDPDNPPEGWVFNESLQKHINPKDEQTWGKVPRNAPCPCGSGKKYKHCHGQL